VRTNGSGLDGAFLTHVLNSPQMLALTEANARGATRPRLNLLMLKKITVPKPSLDEQRRLVAELDDRLATIGALDASNRAQQEAADLLPTTLLRTAFNEITA
jgi:restriction endonuclease S subunit